jgi:hypothetical protein
MPLYLRAREKKLQKIPLNKEIFHFQKKTINLSQS